MKKLFHSARILVIVFVISFVMTLLVSASSGSINEKEPNNIYSKATRTYDDRNNYGMISTKSDVDWFVVRFSKAGKANFWLGHVPSGCDYDLFYITELVLQC